MGSLCDDELFKSFCSLLPLCWTTINESSLLFLAACWIAGLCLVLRPCLVCPLVPGSRTPRSEQQPAKHHRACSSRVAPALQGLKFSVHVANTNLASYAQVFPEVRPLAFCITGPSTVASLGAADSFSLYSSYSFPIQARSS